jgi:hypothetical protein
MDDTRLRLIGPSSGNVSGLHRLQTRPSSSVSHCPSRSPSKNSVAGQRLPHHQNAQMRRARGGRKEPTFSLCVSLAQGEFGLPSRDCRTTKMRERDARAAIAANAAQIRLCVKTVIARLAQSPGTGGRICKAQKSKTRDTSDTQFVADAAGFEPRIWPPVSL